MSDCGASRQKIKHMISECPLRTHQRPMIDFIEATPNVIQWLRGKLAWVAAVLMYKDN